MGAEEFLRQIRMAAMAFVLIAVLENTVEEGGNGLRWVLGAFVLNWIFRAAIGIVRGF